MSSRVKSVVRYAAVLLLFVVVGVGLRGFEIRSLAALNPDEAELLAQARAALGSPVPFTTWTTATTGPVWVFFLVLLGWAGAPLTLAFAHFLAALLLALIGGLGFLLVSRRLPIWLTVILVTFWWLPLVLVLPLGESYADFAALNTELLPVVLILVSALIRVDLPGVSPRWFLVVGILNGLAIGAKYQVAPLSVALVLILLVMRTQEAASWRAFLAGAWRSALFALAGALLPFVVIVLAMVVTPTVSGVLIQQNINFLQAYSEGLSWGGRLLRTNGLFGRSPHLLLLGLIALIVTYRSPKRFAILRILAVLASLGAVYIAGNGFGHYLYVPYAVFPLLMIMPFDPLKKRTSFRVPIVEVASALVALLLGWVIAFGMVSGDPQLTGPTTLRNALSPSTVERDSALSRVCPPGSHVVVWGWAAELYDNYDWTPSMPVITAYQLTITRSNAASGEALVDSRIADPSTDCVIDAVGAPFFSFTKKQSLTTLYPSVASTLASQYRQVSGTIDCEDCRVYVRVPDTGARG